MKIAVLTRGYTEEVLKLLQYLANKGIPIDSVFVEKLYWGNPLNAMLLLFRKYLRTRGLLFSIKMVVEQLANAVRPNREDSRPKWVEKCKSLQIEVVEVNDLNSQVAQLLLRDRCLDIAVVFGTRKLVKETFDIPSSGSINVHHGLLPYYRGSESLFWALYNGEDSAGVTVHKVDTALDVGEILATGTIKLADYQWDYAKCTRALMDLGNRLLAEVLHTRRFQGVRQDESVARYYSLPTVHQRRELEQRLLKRRAGE
jgi:methionyl-tRNA formyltransferase